MKAPTKTEAEQLKFFEICQERFLKATASVGKITQFYDVGGTVVCLLFAGNSLVPHLTPALQHLRIRETRSPDVTFCIWDSDSTATEMVPPPCRWGAFTDRGDIWGFNSPRIKTAFHWIECSVNLMDLTMNTGIFWVQNTKTLPFWVHASPLRTLFHWWMEKNGCQLLHAAAVGTENGAVLITGKGGTGKSTTALACLREGYHYLGDDYVIVRKEPTPQVYSLYSTAKLDADQLPCFSDVSSYVGNLEKLDQEKAVMYLYPHLKGQIVPWMPLKAILTPKITDRDKTTIAPIHTWRMQREMSFTTMSQLPNVGQHTHDYIRNISNTLECYTLELGKDLGSIPTTVMEVLKDLPVLKNSEGSISVSRHTLGFDKLISVIIPVFNGELFIKDAVGSVLAQNYPTMEIIIVDDGSTDRTGETIKELSTDIRYFRQENAGPAAARNRGVRDASGEFIMFLDVDDLWPEYTVETLIGDMLRNPDMEVIHGYAQLLECRDGEKDFNFTGNPKEAFPYYIGSAIYRSTVFNKVGLFDTTLMFGEDSDWFCRANELDIRMKRLNEVTLYVRRHGKNMTEGKNLVELNTLRVFKRSLDRMRNLK